MTKITKAYGPNIAELEARLAAALRVVEAARQDQGKGPELEDALAEFDAGENNPA